MFQAQLTEDVMEHNTLFSNIISFIKYLLIYQNSLKNLNIISSLLLLFCCPLFRWHHKKMIISHVIVDVVLRSLFFFFINRKKYKNKIHNNHDDQKRNIHNTFKKKTHQTRAGGFSGFQEIS